MIGVANAYPAGTKLYCFVHGDLVGSRSNYKTQSIVTIYRADTVLAVVCCAYHKPFTYDRLIIKVIASDRKVAYVAM